MNVDLSIKQGTQEKYTNTGIKKVKVCEDFGLYRNIFPAVVIGDGCSSYKNTVFGSAILCRLYMEGLVENTGLFYNNFYLWLEWLKEKAIEVTKLLSLHPLSLSSTISSIHADDGYLYVNLLNDGYVVYGFECGYRIVKVSYSNNAPYYLVYRFDDMDYQYEREFPDNKVIVESMFFNRNFEKPVPDKIPEYFTFRNIYYETMKISNDLRFVLICTDGLDTFQNVDIMTVYKKLLDLKSLKGEFVQRKMNILIKDFGLPLDDLTIGGIAFEN